MQWIEYYIELSHKQWIVRNAIPATTNILQILKTTYTNEFRCIEQLKMTNAVDFTGVCRISYMQCHTQTYRYVIPYPSRATFLNGNGF